LLSIVGPRTLHHGKEYSIFVSAIDYYGEKIEISLTGNKLGEEIASESFKLGHDNKNVTFDVSERILFVAMKIIFCVSVALRFKNDSKLHADSKNS
jgi:hypothetical protein